MKLTDGIEYSHLFMQYKASYECPVSWAISHAVWRPTQLFTFPAPFILHIDLKLENPDTQQRVLKLLKIKKTEGLQLKVQNE